jgi:hypothetical protein
MTTQGLIPRYSWRNERARKNVFERADKMEYAFVLHLDPSNSGTQSKMKAFLLTSSSEVLKKSNYFHKNNQTENLFSYGESSTKFQGTTVLFFVNSVSENLVFLRGLLKFFQSPYLMLGLLSKKYFYNRLDVYKLFELQKNQHSLFINNIASQNI